MLSTRINLIRLGGHANEIVTKTVHTTLLGVVGVKGPGGQGSEWVFRVIGVYQACCIGWWVVVGGLVFAGMMEV